MCAPQDVAVVYQVKCPFTDRPTIIVYDNCPGGVGLAAKAYAMQNLLLEKALRIVSDCPCPQGCPSCAGPVGEIGTGRQSHRQGAAEGADRMPLNLRDKLRAVDGPRRPTTPVKAEPVFRDCWHDSRVLPLDAVPGAWELPHGDSPAHGAGYLARAAGTRRKSSTWIRKPRDSAAGRARWLFW